MVTQANPQGNGVVERNKLVKRTDKEFTDGVCSGYLTYHNQCEGMLLTDQDVYIFIIQNIADVQGTNAFNAGCCTEWIGSLRRQEGSQLR